MDKYDYFTKHYIYYTKNYDKILVGNNYSYFNNIEKDADKYDYITTKLNVRKNYERNISGVIYKCRLKNINISNLQIIDLSNNNIHRISNNILDDLVNLEKLKLSNNRIQDIEKDAFTNNKKLKELNLDHNIITNIDFIESLINIEKLRLSHNSIITIKKDNFIHNTNIKEIYLNSNDILEINIKHLNKNKQLRVLDLRNNDDINIKNKEFYFHIFSNNINYDNYILKRSYKHIAKNLYFPIDNNEIITFIYNLYVIVNFRSYSFSMYRNILLSCLIFSININIGIIDIYDMTKIINNFSFLYQTQTQPYSPYYQNIFTIITNTYTPNENMIFTNTHLSYNYVKNQIKNIRILKDKMDYKLSIKNQRLLLLINDLHKIQRNMMVILLRLITQRIDIIIPNEIIFLIYEYYTH